MNKKLRRRISRVISTFKTCRPRVPSAVGPPVLHLDFSTPPPPPRPSPTSRMAAMATDGCRSYAPAATAAAPGRWSAGVDAWEDDMSRARETPAYLWRKEEKWHVVNVSKDEFGTIERRKKVDCDDDEDEDDDLFPASIRQMAASRRRKREIQIRRARARHSQKFFSHRNSTSSVASSSWFSSDDDQENDERSEEYNEEDEGDDTDTLLSSRSFSTDSSVVANRPRTSGAAAMLSRLMPCGADNNRAKVVKESFAVVKKSENPRGDFRRSMAEMVIQKGIYNAADLEQLLDCFLSLNSQQHHRAIISAFADVWDAIFPAES